MCHTCCTDTFSAWESHNCPSCKARVGRSSTCPMGTLLQDGAKLDVLVGPGETWRQQRCWNPCRVCLFGDKCLALSIRSHAWRATLGWLASHVLLGSHRWCREWITDNCKGNKLNLQELFAREWFLCFLWRGKWRPVIRCLHFFSDHCIFMIWMLLVNQLQVIKIKACGPETVESETKLCLSDSAWSIFKRLCYCIWNLSGFVPLIKCIHSRWWHQPPLSECRYLYYAKAFFTLLHSDDDWRYHSCYIKNWVWL